MQAVGIGCVWFARRADGDDDDIDLADFIPSSHVADIRQALEGLDSVTNLRIEGNENSLSGIAGLDDDTEDQTFFPMFGSLVIHFDLLVPLRAHEKYLGADGQRRKSKPVRVVYEGAMPVTYVYYTVAVGKDDVHDHSPSTAIVVVRKFLDEKLRDHPVVLFQMLGPSPCHVDVFIGEASVEASDDVTDLSVRLIMISFDFKLLRVAA